MKLDDRLYLVGGGAWGLSHTFDCNVYVIDTGVGLVMVDSGAGLGVEAILANMARDGLDVSRKPIRWLLLTHSHADHAGGAYLLRQRFQCEVVIGEPEADIVEQGGETDLKLDVAKRSGFYSPDYKFNNCEVTVRLSHEDELNCAGLKVRALLVPGHSPGSVCYLVDFDFGRALFTGDVVFPDGVLGLLNCDGSSLKDYRESLPTLRGLGVDLLLPGHGRFVLREGQKHIDLACERLRCLQIPPSFI